MNDSGGNDAWDGQYAEWIINTLSGPKKSIKNAVGTVSEGGTVNIADGNYTGENNTNIDINKNINIIGQSKEYTIINGTNSAQIFQIQSGKTVNIENLTFANGKSTLGGAISNLRNVNLTIKNSIFIYNTGSAIYNSYSSNLTVNDCTFTNNTGSAIYNSYSSNLTVNDCTFTSNTGSQGGAIANLYGSNLTTTNCNYNGNTGGMGGAIFNTYSSNLAISGCNFTNNTASYGGTIANMYSSYLNATNSNFVGNTASYDGGILYNTYTTTSEVHFNRIVGNTARTGADISCYFGSVNATNNWWGSNANPSGRMYGNVTVNPWLVLTVNSNSTIIISGGTSTLTADLLHDNGILSDPTHPDFYYHDPTSDHVPDGTIVNFATNLGSINNPLSTINGITQSTLSYVGLMDNIATVSAAIDSQTVQTSVRIDTIPPAVSATPTNGLSNSAINVNLLSESDATIYYKINGGSWNTFTGSGTVSISDERTNSLEFYAVDTAGNPSGHTTYTYTIDKTNPTVTANHPSGTYNNIKTVILTATDSFDQNPEIYYSTNNGVTWNHQAKTVTLNLNQGKTVLMFYAKDAAGNQCPTQTVNYTIDTIPPKIITTTPKNGATGVSRTSTITIRFSENIKSSINWSKIVVKDKYGRTVKFTKSIAGNMLYIRTTYKRSSYSYYTVYIPASALKDYVGLNAAGYTFRFKTGRY